MKKRNPIAVALLPFITFNIYFVYWFVVTKREMVAAGATDLPTSWLLIIPIVNIWWMWRYSKGVEKITSGNLSGALSFVLLWLAGSIGAAIVQDSFNNSSTPTSAAPVSPIS
jgi:hypothetical protein